MKKTALLLALCLLAAVREAPAAEISRRGGAVLKAQSGARPRGMGNAFAAVADDANCLFINPAGLGIMRHVEFTAMNRFIPGAINQSHAALVVPMGNVSARNVRNFGSFGAFFKFVDYGRIPERDAAGAATGGDFSARDGVLGLSYGKPLSARLAFGVNAKLYGMYIADQKARGSAYDAGIIFKPTPDRWTLALAAFNLGGDFRFGRADEALPKYVLGGVAFTPWRDRLTLAADIVDPQDDVVGLRTGAEWWANDVVALRAGYDSSSDIGQGVSMGIGFRARQAEAIFFPVQRFSLDYAFIPYGDISGSRSLGGIHNVSFTMRFGDRD